jgi:addiction module HigA family antidote
MVGQAFSLPGQTKPSAPPQILKRTFQTVRDQGARILGVTRQVLNNLVNGKSGVSPEMAWRLAKAFGSTPETWLRLRMNCDLAGIRRRSDKITVGPRIERHQAR